MCKHAHYRWGSREHRCCLIHQNLSFFLGLTTMAIILDNTRHAPSPTPLKIMIEPILSLVLGGLRTEMTLFKSLGNSMVPNILIWNMRFAFRFYVVENKRKNSHSFPTWCCSQPGARLLLSEWGRLQDLIFSSLPWNWNTQRKLPIAVERADCLLPANAFSFPWLGECQGVWEVGGK